MYVNAHICGKPITKVFIDNGAVFNVMPLKTLKMLGKGIHDLSPVDFEMTSFTGQPTRQEGKRSGASVMLEGPDGQRVKLQLQLEAMTHNSGEYKALILGLEALIVRSVQSVIIRGDSQLIIYRYGIPYSITTDQGLVFTGEKFLKFLVEFGIRLNHSSPYYPQANEQAETTNKIIIGIIKKTIERNPRKWHLLLSRALWAHRNNKNSATGFSPYQLTFGQDVVLPAEIQVSSGRTSLTTDEFTEEYQQVMLQQLESLEVNRLRAIDQIVKQSEIRAKTYGRKVFYRTFKE
ncbi:uncharacterized protein LOC127260408 [Andrographis paniculata]|uniref:uncharacterized protein LOC127260408 n=1 Tax=Andrographis paniculata TaxID=175694 RepID=UPI0021E6FCC3|nr:uncharacterized protein LOC127260408 [Andrographis paniculata]